MGSTIACESVSPIFDKKVGITFLVYREGVWSSVHSLLQPDGESTDLEGLFSLFNRLGILKAQVLELVGDEVELTEGDPLTWLLLF